MTTDEPAQSSLLALPGDCLRKVLQCCAADGEQRSLFSAARAHPRLHQAAVATLTSITANVAQQQKARGVLLYLRKHGQHVEQLRLKGGRSGTVSLRQQPPNLQLNTLQLEKVHLQLQPGGGFQGVLGAAAGLAALKQLCLSSCTLLDGSAGLAAALLLLPALEHLSISGLQRSRGDPAQVVTGVLQRLQQLTYLELAAVDFRGPDVARPALQPLQALTKLADLRLGTVPPMTAHAYDRTLEPRMLSGAQHLTRLEVSRYYHGMFEPGVLAGKTQLQHLRLKTCIVPDAEWMAELLSHLQPLQQLTLLDLTGTLWADWGGNPPAAAYSALTASSKLQDLSIDSGLLPPGVWQHLFPAGRQLPQLQFLDITDVELLSGDTAPAPEGSRLVSCCPGLQSLYMGGLRCSTQLLVALPGLRELHTLRLSVVDDPTAASAVEAVCQLTGLRELAVRVPYEAEGLLVPLTQLRQLTSLSFSPVCFHWSCQAPGDEPVWRKLARHFLKHSDPQVAQRAAAALAE